MKKRFDKSDKHFKYKIILPAFITIFLFVLVSFTIFIPHIEKTMISQKKENLQELSNAALSIIKDNVAQEEEGTHISLEKAQKSAIKEIRF